jgi:hypothetical protein
MDRDRQRPAYVWGRSSPQFDGSCNEVIGHSEHVRISGPATLPPDQTSRDPIKFSILSR